jgi:hypothetical protein
MTDSPPGRLRVGFWGRTNYEASGSLQRHAGNPDCRRGIHRLLILEGQGSER